MVHHVLPESEPFSEHFGGALSRWTANVLRDDETAKILAPACDASWGFGPDRIRTLPRSYSSLLKIAQKKIPPDGRRQIARMIFRSAFRSAGKGDVVYVHNRPEFAAAINDAYPKRDFKLVLHMHNSHLVNYPDTQARCADMTVFCSEFLRAEAEGKLAGSASAIIPNGADEDKFYPAFSANRSGKPSILFVGRLVPEKGIEVFLKAMRFLPDAGALVVGAAQFGSEKETAFTRKLKNDAPSNVVFASYTSGRDLADKFRSAAIFCCPSTFNEPFGMVNVEAMASGLPVVATRVGGIPEVFRDGGALLVPPNDPNKLAEALRLLLSNPVMRSDLAAEGLASFRKNYRWEVVRCHYRNSVAAVVGRLSSEPAITHPSALPNHRSPIVPLGDIPAWLSLPRRSSTTQECPRTTPSNDTRLKPTDHPPQHWGTFRPCRLYPVDRPQRRSVPRTTPVLPVSLITAWWRATPPGC